MNKKINSEIFRNIIEGIFIIHFLPRPKDIVNDSIITSFTKNFLGNTVESIVNYLSFINNIYNYINEIKEKFLKYF